MKIESLGYDEVYKIVNKFSLLESHLKKRNETSFYKDYPNIIFYLGAKKDNEVIGVVGYELIFYNVKEFLYLSPLEVLTEYKKKGIASLLVNEIKNKSKTLNKEGVLLICTWELISFYKKNGFEIHKKFKDNENNKFIMIYKNK